MMLLLVDLLMVAPAISVSVCILSVPLRPISQSAAAALEKQLPNGLDVLINNAGVNGAMVNSAKE